MPLLRDRTQHRLPPPTPTAPPAAAAGCSRRGIPTAIRLLVGEPRRRHRLPAAPAFVAAAPHEGGAGLDGERGHLLRLQGPLQAAEGQGEVEAAGEELVVGVDGGDDVVELHLVGVADEAVAVLLEDVGGLDRVRELLEPPVHEDELGRRDGGGFAGTADTH